MSSMPQVIDAVTLTNTMTVAMAPAMAMGSLYMNIANSMGMMAMNQVFSQQQTNITHQTSMIVGIKQLFSDA